MTPIQVSCNQKASLYKAQLTKYACLYAMYIGFII